MRPGGANNPLGLGGKSGKTAEDVEIVNATNVSNDKESKGTIHGNTSDYALRRLTKAAKGQKSHGVEPSPDLQAKFRAAGAGWPGGKSPSTGLRLRRGSARRQHRYSGRCDLAPVSRTPR